MYIVYYIFIYLYIIRRYILVCMTVRTVLYVVYTGIIYFYFELHRCRYIDSPAQ